MSENLKVLNNIRSLRVQARELSFKTLEEILEKFKVIVTERCAEEKVKDAEISQRAEKVNKLRQLMLEDGIDPAELYEFSAVQPKPKKSALVQQNTSTPMIMAKPKPGQVRAAHRNFLRDMLPMGARLMNF